MSEVYSLLEQRIVDGYLKATYPDEPTAPEPMQVAQAPAPTMTDVPADSGSIREIPRNMFQQALGKFGDALTAAGVQLDKVGLDIPALGRVTLKDLTVGEAGKVIEDMSYGFMPVRGAGGIGGTAGLKPEAVELLNVPIVGTAAKAVGTAARVMRRALPAAAAAFAAQPTEAEGGVGSLAKKVAQGFMPVKVGERVLQIPAEDAAVLQRAVKNLTPEEQGKFRTDTAQKFVSMLSDLPSTKEFAAAALGGAAKKGWYEGSTQAIVNVFGPDAPRFAALLSATSPQTSVESNLYNALQIWKNWTAAGRPTDREGIVAVMGRSVQGSKGEGSVLDAWKNNTVAALSAEDPGKVVLSGPKVNSFMLNLQGNVNEVTNDAWMASFSLVDQKIFGGSLTKGGDPGKGPGYLAMNARVRETADYLTKISGEKWTPAEVQETIWSWAKTLYEMAGSAGEKRSAVQLIRDKALTDELIASTPDFRTLFYDARFQPILEQAGYGEQLARLRDATAATDAAAGVKKPGVGSQAGPLDPEAQRKLNERNARRLDRLRKQREQASAEKAQVQTPTGGAE